MKQYIILTFIGLALSSCNKDDSNSSIEPFTVENDTTISLNGEIDSNTLNAFNTVLGQNPNTKWLIFKEAPGSNDDEVNVQVGRRLHALGIHTQVENNGLIASGAVDLFLAGNRRVLGENVMVGVHSWSDGRNEATDFPRDSEEHQLFIQYYRDIGMRQQLAEDFYFFTINAAPAADIHYMTQEEIELYEIENP